MPVRYGVHRPLQIGPVHRYVSLRATLDYVRRRKAELVVIAAATNDGPGLQGVQKFFAARVTAAVVACDQQCRHPATQVGNNQLFGGPAGIARQDHPGFTKRYLQNERGFVQVPLQVFYGSEAWVEQPYSGPADLQSGSSSGKVRIFIFRFNAISSRASGGILLGRRVVPGDFARPEGPNVEIAKDEAKPKRMVGVIVREDHVVQPADSLVPQIRGYHRTAGII